jgi:hypothetical protein
MIERTCSPKREPRDYSPNDLERIIRIVCQRHGPKATQNAIKRARVPGKHRAGCRYMDEVCQKSKVKAMSEVLAFAVAAVGILVMIWNLLNSPLFKVFFRRFPALLAAEQAIRLALRANGLTPARLAQLSSQSDDLLVNWLPKLRDLCKIPKLK